MRARYETWIQRSLIQTVLGFSFIWKEICARDPTVLAQVRWFIGDGTGWCKSRYLDLQFAILPMANLCQHGDG